VRYAERTVDIDVIPQAAVPYFEVPLFPRPCSTPSLRAWAPHRRPRQGSARAPDVNRAG